MKTHHMHTHTYLYIPIQKCVQIDAYTLGKEIEREKERETHVHIILAEGHIKLKCFYSIRIKFIHSSSQQEITTAKKRKKKCLRLFLVPASLLVS